MELSKKIQDLARDIEKELQYGGTDVNWTVEFPCSGCGSTVEAESTDEWITGECSECDELFTLQVETTPDIILRTQNTSTQRRPYAAEVTADDFTYDIPVEAVNIQMARQRAALEMAERGFNDFSVVNVVPV